MSTGLFSLMFLWLLPVTAHGAVTSGQNHNFTHVMRDEGGSTFTYDQLTTQEASSLNPFSEERTTQPSTKPSLPTSGTRPPKPAMTNIQTTATPTNPRSRQLDSSTGDMRSTTPVQFELSTPMTVVSRQTSNPAATSRVPPVLSSSTQSRATGNTLTSQFNADETTHPSTSPTRSTNISFTTTTSTKPAENTSTSTRPLTGSHAAHSTRLYQTSPATKTSSNIINKKRDEPAETNATLKTGTNHSTAVAGLIGGALVLMMVGFLVIYVKKRKIQRQQVTTKDWAGPSPFLEGGVDNKPATLRSSNRVSLISFLPNRLSKRLSLLPETNEELEDMTPGTTFGNQYQESTCGPETDEKDGQESNGSAVVVSEMKSTEDPPEMVTNSVSVS